MVGRGVVIEAVETGVELGVERVVFTVVLVPGAGAEVPGAGVVVPRAGVEVPGTGAVVPGTGVVVPGTGVVVPGAGVVVPGAGVVVPRAGVLLVVEVVLGPVVTGGAADPVSVVLWVAGGVVWAVGQGSGEQHRTLIW